MGICRLLFYSAIALLLSCEVEDKPREFTDLGAVTISSITPDIAKGQNVIAWKSVSRASGYHLYWSNNSDLNSANGTQIWNVSPPYTHTGLKNGVDYYYVVVAYDRTGTSPFATPVSTRLLGRPSDIVVKQGDAHIDIAWTKSDDATSYNIYYDPLDSNDANADLSLIAEKLLDAGTKIELINDANYSLDANIENDTNYVAVVTTQNNFGESFPSQVIFARPLSTPYDVRAFSGVGGEIRIFFKAALSARGNNYMLGWSLDANTLADEVNQAGLFNPIEGDKERASGPYSMVEKEDALYYSYGLSKELIQQKDYYITFAAKNNYGRSIDAVEPFVAQALRWSRESLDGLDDAQSGYNSRLYIDKQGSLYVLHFDRRTRQLLQVKKTDKWQTPIAIEGSLSGAECCFDFEIDFKGRTHLFFLNEVTGGALSYYRYEPLGKLVTQTIIDTDIAAVRTAVDVVMDREDPEKPIIHMAYFKNSDTEKTRLIYRQHDANDTPTDWTEEIVTQVDGAGVHSAISRNESGSIYIAYVDPSDLNLHIYTKADTTWERNTIEISQNKVGSYPRMITDRQGVPHLCYADETADEIHHASFVAGAWSVETVASNTQDYCGIGIHSDGSVHIAYYDDIKRGGNLRYAIKVERWLQAELNTDGSDLGESIGQTPLSLATEGGATHITYNAFGRLKYVRVEYTTINQ